jgi:hypothetical protein
VQVKKKLRKLLDSMVKELVDRLEEELTDDMINNAPDELIDADPAEAAEYLVSNVVGKIARLQDAVESNIRAMQEDLNDH